MKRTLLTSALAIALGFSSAYAADGDITVTVDYSNGSVADRTWTSTATPGATVSMNGGDLLEDNGYLFFNTAAQTRTVTIASTSDEYYVSAYTMSVISVSTDVVTFTAGTQSVASSPTPQTFAVSGITEEETASFTITPAVAEAKKATVKEFTVTLSKKTGTTPEPEPEPEVDYTLNLGTTTGQGARYISALTVTTDAGSETISGLRTSMRGNIYFDKSSSEITASPGSTVTVQADGAGEWMHNYLYVDWDKNGFEYNGPSDYLEINTVAAINDQYKLKKGVDLVFFNLWCPSASNGLNHEKYWYSSNGYVGENTGNNIHQGSVTNTPMTFTVPEGTPEGEYRVRVKIAWCSLDPNGGKDSATNNDIKSDNGQIVDFTLVVEKAPVPTEGTGSIKFDNEIEGSGGIYSKIQNITFILPEGATTTGNGTIKVETETYIYDENDEPIEGDHVVTEYNASDLTAHPSISGTYILTLNEPIEPSKNEEVISVAATVPANFFAVYNDKHQVITTINSFRKEAFVIFYPEGNIPDTTFELTTTPAGGEIVEALPKVTFFAPENSEWWNPNNDCSETAVITRNGETIATYPASIVADEYYNYGEDSYYLPVPQDNKAGTYTLTVPEKFFKSNLGYSAAKTITWTVLGSYTQEQGIIFPDEIVGKVPAISFFYIPMPENSAVTGNGEITIKSEETSETVATISADNVTYNTGKKAYQATLTEPIETEGTYKIAVPRGFFQIVSEDDAQVPTMIVEAIHATIKVVIEEDSEPVALTVTPAESTVNALPSITITYIDEEGTRMSIMPTGEDEDAVITLAKGTETVLSLDFDSIFDHFAMTDEEVEYVNIACDLTKAGTYTLTIPAGFFIVPEINAVNQATTMTWTIDENVGISEIEVSNGSQTIVYDLQGRRADSSARGILIVNGVKTLVK